MLSTDNILLQTRGAIADLARVVFGDDERFGAPMTVLERTPDAPYSGTYPLCRIFLLNFNVYRMGRTLGNNPDLMKDPDLYGYRLEYAAANSFDPQLSVGDIEDRLILDAYDLAIALADVSNYTLGGLVAELGHIVPTKFTYDPYNKDLQRLTVMAEGRVTCVRRRI